MSHQCPRQREEIRGLKKKSSVKRQKWTEPERKLDKCQSVVSEVEGAAGFVRTQERCRVSFFSAGQVRTPASYMFHSMFLCFANVAAVVVILAIAHIADVAVELGSLLLNLAC